MLVSTPSQLVNPLGNRRRHGFGTGAGGAAAFAGVLDAYATNLWEAWGFARLLSSYTGNLAQVRETGGSTSANIGYSPATGLLDTAALAAHVGANNGFVAQVHGQANSRHLLQATSGAQPRIVNAGTNVTIGTEGVAMEVVANDTQRMVTGSVTAYTGIPLTMMAVHVGVNAAVNYGRGPLNILDATNRSDSSDALACFQGNGSRGTGLMKGDLLNNLTGTSTGAHTRVLFGVFDGTNKVLYDSKDLPGSSTSNAETTAFNFDRAGVWSYTASAGWSVAGEKWAAGAVWTRALSSAEVYAITAAMKTLFGFS